MLSTLQLAQVLMLASSNLPIGSYTYSQGVESAIEHGLIVDESSALYFMQQYQQSALMEFDIPLAVSLMWAMQQQHWDLADVLADMYQSSRDSYEFALESEQLALAFRAWIDAVIELDVPVVWQTQGFLPMFARLASYWQLDIIASMMTYAFSQIENMTLAIVKTLPLGQMAGQRIIWQVQQQLAHELQQKIPQYLAQLQQLDRKQPIEQQLMHLMTCLPLSSALPKLSELSCLHEQQYSRLFRS